ncbi:MAG TPA: zinc-dependent metalloprotease [Chloroflexota bacterium]|nr:zinc-dependent metalloprotease [Chloroflexota bacterium]
MANGRLVLRAGMLMGAVAGALYLAAGRRWLDMDKALFDWERVQDMANRTSGRMPISNPWVARKLRSSYEEMVQTAEGPIAAYTGTSLPSAGTSVQVVNRQEWIAANVANFRYLFEPVEEIYSEVGSRGSIVPGMAQLSQLAVSSQIGLLLGYLSQRVLGQYDMSLLGKEPITSGKLYFVEQNIESIERSLEIPGEEFRLWIVLHESTHAHEFECFPWLRDYMNHTLRAYLDCILQEVRRSSSGSGLGATLLPRMVENLRSGRSILESVMTPRQQEYMNHMQALMCLLEGYSNHVMNAVGRQVMPHYQEIKKAMDSRQKERSQAEKLFLKLTGLSMKMEQYRLGEQFVDRVVEARGIQFVNRAYDGPDSLPTMDEVLHPERWIARIEVS